MSANPGTETAATGSPKKYSYRRAQPQTAERQAGQYMPKEMRMQQVGVNKKSHFTFGYDNNSIASKSMAHADEAKTVDQKWNFQPVKGEGNNAKTHFSIGQSGAFHAQSTNKADFQLHSQEGQADARVQRQQLMNELRKSHLPSGQDVTPVTTNQACFQGPQSQGSTNAEQQKEKQAIVNRVRGVKPNFQYGNDKVSYQTANTAATAAPHKSGYVDKQWQKEHAAS